MYPTQLSLPPLLRLGLLGFWFALVSGTIAYAQAPGGGSKVQPSAAEPNDIDLSPQFEKWSLSLKSQRQRDTCAVFTVTGAIEFGLAKSLDQGVSLSEEYLNWAANDVAGDWEDGATFTELQQGFNKWGISRSLDMPYRPIFFASNAPSQGALKNAHKTWQLKPKWNWIARQSTNGLSASDVAAVKRVLRRGWPVCAEGEHCLLLVAYNNEWEGGSFLARDYASQNYETLTYSDFQRRFESLLWIQFPTQAVDEK